MRSRPLRVLSKVLPARLGRFLAVAYRGISERKKARKRDVGGGSRFHTIQRGIEEELLRSDCDVVLCGHIHDAADRTLAVAGRSRRIITTGAWEDGPNHVVWEKGALRLEMLDPEQPAHESVEKRPEEALPRTR